MLSVQADQKVIEQNDAFKAIADALLEELNDKELVIKTLRTQNAQLGETVLKLDERFSQLAQLP